MQHLTGQQVITQHAAVAQQHQANHQTNTIGHIIQAHTTPQENGTHVLISSHPGPNNVGGQTQTILHLSAETDAQMGMTTVQPGTIHGTIHGTDQFASPLAIVPMARLTNNELPIGMVANLTNIPRDMTFMNL